MGVLSASIIGEKAQSSSGFESHTMGPNTSYSGAIRGRPIIARFAEMFRRSATDVAPAYVSDASGVIYRDSLGRTRTDLIQDSHGRKNERMSLSVIVDPVSRVSYVLDPSTMVAIRRPFSAGENAGASGWIFPGSSVEAVGTEVVEGVECRHVRVGRTIPGSEPSFLHVWICDELTLIMSEQSQTADETYTWHATEVRREAPDPSHFIVPLGYKTIIPVSSPGKRART